MPYIPTMPNFRILPATAVAALVPLFAWAGPQAPGTPPTGSVEAAQAKAAAVAAAANEPPTEAESQLDAAAKKLAAVESVAADMLQTVKMLDQGFEIKGRYLKAPGRRVYLLMTVSGLPDAKGSMLQVCDGNVLWDYQRILDAERYQKMEVGKVFEKLQSPEIDPKLRETIVSQLGFAGPAELIAGLRRLVKFEIKESSTLDGKDVWVFTGEWKSRDGLTGPNGQQLPATAALPAFVPTDVKLTVGKGDGFPYKLLLVGRPSSVMMDTRKIGPDGKPIGARSSIQAVKPTRIELTYSNVKLNPELKADEFAFQAPPGAQPEDNTQALLGMLDQAIQVALAKKKAEASKEGTGTGAGPADDSLLKESIPIPRGTPAAPPAGGPAPR